MLLSRSAATIRSSACVRPRFPFALTHPNVLQQPQLRQQQHLRAFQSPWQQIARGNRAVPCSVLDQISGYGQRLPCDPCSMRPGTHIALSGSYRHITFHPQRKVVGHRLVSTRKADVVIPSMSPSSHGFMIKALGVSALTFAMQPLRTVA